MREELGLAVFDQHGIFEIRDPQLLAVVVGGSDLELSGYQTEGTNSGCINGVCLNGGNQACANTNVTCTWTNMKFCIQANGNGVNTVCV